MIASFDASDEGQDLIIEEDQFQLVRPQEDEQTSQESPKSSKDEDYNWFIGEMKKEIEDGPGRGSKTEKVVPRKKPETVPPKDRPRTELKYDDAGTEAPSSMTAGRSDKGQAPSSRPVPKSAQPPPLSDAELSRIVDKIAADLAARIASRIDRKMLLEAVKAALEN